MFYVKYCINCGQKASIFSGHLKSEDGFVIAGWCSDKKCRDRMDGLSIVDADNVGCFGKIEDNTEIVYREF